MPLPQALSSTLALKPYYLAPLKLLSPQESEGLTLLELLIVVVLIGIFAAIALPFYLGWIDSTKYAQAKIQMNCTAKELQTLKLEKGYFPPDTSRNVAPSGINCFYLQSSQQIPFNSKYDYENWQVAQGCYVQITFLGKDGEKQFPNNSPLYPNPGFYEYQDDLVLSLGIQQQSVPCQ